MNTLPPKQPAQPKARQVDPQRLAERERKAAEKAAARKAEQERNAAGKAQKAFEAARKKFYKEGPLADEIAKHARVAQTLVTHSAKLSNTNVSPAPLMRIGRDTLRDLPYACARTAPRAVALDFCENAADAQVARNIRLIMEGDARPAQFLSAELFAALRDTVIPRIAPRDAGSAAVSHKMRQLMAQDEVGRDVSLSPLPSGGLHAQVNAAVSDAVQSAVKNFRAKPHTKPLEGRVTVGLHTQAVLLHIGGTNAQNAGGLAAAARRGYLFGAPAGPTPQERAAFAIHHKGIDIRPRADLAQAYGRWLAALAKRNGGQIRRSARRMDAETQHLREMVEDILRRGRRAAAMLRPLLGKEIDAMTAKSVPLEVRGVIDPSLRDQAWGEAFVKAFTRDLVSVRVGDEIACPMSPAAAQLLEPVIKEILS